MCFNVQISQKVGETKRCRLDYVRYISDYLIAVRGSKQQAEEIKKRSEAFLTSSLCSTLAQKDLID